MGIGDRQIPGLPRKGGLLPWLQVRNRSAHMPTRHDSSGHKKRTGSLFNRHDTSVPQERRGTCSGRYPTEIPRSKDQEPVGMDRIMLEKEPVVRPTLQNEGFQRYYGQRILPEMGLDERRSWILGGRKNCGCTMGIRTGL